MHSTPSPLGSRPTLYEYMKVQLMPFKKTLQNPAPHNFHPASYPMRFKFLETQPSNHPKQAHPSPLQILKPKNHHGSYYSPPSSASKYGSTSSPHPTSKSAERLLYSVPTIKSTPKPFPSPSPTSGSASATPPPSRPTYSCSNRGSSAISTTSNCTQMGLINS